MDAANIRVDATLVAQHQGKLVRIIGKCESYDSDSLTATIISNGSISLTLQEGEVLKVGKIYEIIGKVSTSDYKVNVYNVIELSDNVNLEVAQKLVQYVHKVPELFY
ncbi:replication factor A protein 3 [Scheffersomyces xylosifermentans]|uniref:replication factor A protein 3 n=1 Tax=Scheffersomyces xylosifermentans TaxID=1304137 RepID=UPI00315D4D8A